MPGYNLATLAEEFRAGFLGSRRSPESLFAVPDYEIFRLINESYLYYQKLMKIELKRNTSLTLTSGTPTYTLPASRMAHSIEEIRLVNSTSTGEISLEKITPAEMRDRYYLDSTSTDSGDPAYWCYSENTLSQIIIRPVPTWTASGGIRISHSPIPTPLERIYFPASSTAAASIANASTALTINAGTSTVSDIAVRIQAGDEIGIIETANFDGETVSNGSSIKWYGISAVTASSGSTAVTLAESWTGLAKTTARFIVGQVSELEVAMPAFLGFVPVYRALYLKLRREAPDDARMYKELADEFLSNFAIEEPGTDNYGYKNTAHFSWMNL